MVSQWVQYIDISEMSEWRAGSGLIKICPIHHHWVTPLWGGVMNNLYIKNSIGINTPLLQHKYITAHHWTCHKSQNSLLVKLPINLNQKAEYRAADRSPRPGTIWHCLSYRVSQEYWIGFLHFYIPGQAEHVNTGVLFYSSDKAVGAGEGRGERGEMLIW